MTMQYTGPGGLFDRLAADIARGIAYPRDVGAWIESAERGLSAQVAEETALSSSAAGVALERLRELMLRDGESIAERQVHGTVNADGANVGSTELVVGTIDADEETVNAISEEIRVEVVQDGQDSATSGNELLSALGGYQVGRLDRDWPGGSGAAGSFRVVSSNGPGNRAARGGFDSWLEDPAKPDGWALLGGTSVEETSNVARPGSAIRVAAGVPYQIGSTFGDDQGAVYRLEPRTVYALGLFVRAVSTPATGALEVKIADDGTGLDIGNTTLSIPAAQLSPSWTHFSLFFATPAALGSGAGYRVDVNYRTAMSEVTYLDELVVQRATRLGDGGVFAAAFASTKDPRVNDAWTIGVVNNAAPGSWNYELPRFVGNRAIVLPTDPSPSIEDSLIANG